MMAAIHKCTRWACVDAKSGLRDSTRWVPADVATICHACCCGQVQEQIQRQRGWKSSLQRAPPSARQLCRAGCGGSKWEPGTGRPGGAAGSCAS